MKQMKRTFLSAALVLSMALAMSACGGNNNSNNNESSDSTASTQNMVGLTEAPYKNTEKTDETLVVATTSEPSMLMSASGLQEDGACIVEGYILDRVVTVNPETKELEPSLATAWEWMDDTHLKLTLRDDVVMADGSLMTAEDVLFSVLTAAEYASTTDCGRHYNPEECYVVDDHTVVIGLKTVAPDFLYSMAENSFGIFSKSAVESLGGVESAKQNPVYGSGKYTFKEWKSGEYILLERNENYWDENYVGYYKYIKFIFVNDAAARQMAVESGDADIALDMPLNISAPFVNSADVNVEIYESGQVSHIYFNCNSGIFADAKVREAAAYALDVDNINQMVSLGFGERFDGFANPESVYFYDPAQGERRERDVKKAKQLMAEAGYADGVEAKAIIRSAQTSIMTVVQENLREIGIDLAIETLDTTQFVASAQNGEYDVVYGNSITLYRKPDAFNLLESTALGRVIGGPKYASAELDALILQARTGSEEEVKEAYKQIAEICYNEYLCVDLCTEVKSVMTAPELIGFQLFGRGYLDCSEAYPLSSENN